MKGLENDEYCSFLGGPNTAIPEGAVRRRMYTNTPYQAARDREGYVNSNDAFYSTSSDSPSTPPFLEVKLFEPIREIRRLRPVNFKNY